MARDFYISGESMLYVKGASGTLIGSVQELGLCDGPIQVELDSQYLDLTVDTHAQVPVDVQYRLSSLIINATLVHYDAEILDECLRINMAAPLIGTTGAAWRRLGGGTPLYDNANAFITLGISSPVEARPYRFLTCYLFGPPFVIPIGTERSRTQVRFKCIPYNIDPWNNGNGARGNILWDYVSMV